MLSDTWEPLEDRDELEDALAELARVDEQLAVYKSRRDELKNQIVAQLQTDAGSELEPGDHFLVRGGWKATVVVPEVWDWDQEKLDALVATSAKTDYPIKTKHFVDKRAFEKADADKRAEMRTALTRKPGSPRIKVEAA